MLQVAQTCQLALQRMQWLAEHTAPEQQAFRTIDPAPAAPEDTPTSELREQLLDERAPIFERYQALFALRNQVCPVASPVQRPAQLVTLRDKCLCLLLHDMHGAIVAGCLLCATGLRPSVGPTAAGHTRMSSLLPLG